MTILKKKKGHCKGEAKSEGSHQNAHNIVANSIQSHSQIRESGLDERCWNHRDEIHSGQLESLENETSGGTKRWVKGSPIRSIRSSKFRDRGPSILPGSPRPWSKSPNTSPKPGPSTAPDEDCNSEDEYERNKSEFTEPEWTERDRIFEKRLRKNGLCLKEMKEDGACLFRAVSDQIYGDQEMHDVVRKHCMDYIAANRDYYSQYMTEDFNAYINRKRKDRTHGNHIEIHAMCEMYNRPIEVFCYSKDPINIFHVPRVSDTVNEPIRLSYQRGSHYNSIVDPYKATVGVGLGLPNNSPGKADKSLVKDAVRQSEELEIEQTMLEDKLRATDWEATNEAIEEQVARESYVQWYKENEARKKSAASKNQKACCSSTITSSVVVSEGSSSSNDNTGLYSVASPQNSMGKNYSPQDFHINETASFLNLFTPELFGMTDWEDVDILTQVLATSQEEYLESLKRQQYQKDNVEENK